MSGLTITFAALAAMVWVRVGQRLDFSAFEGRKWLAQGLRRTMAHTLHIGAPAVLVVTIGVVVAFTFLHRGPTAALAAGVAGPMVLLLVTFLKVALPRAELLRASWVSSENTYPSGHLAVTTTVMLIAISASPPRWRARVTTAAVASVTITILAVAGSGWHRPSDLVGSLGLATFVSAVASIPILRQWRRGSASQLEADRNQIGSLRCDGFIITSLCIAWFVAGLSFGHSSYGNPITHVIAVCSIAGLGSALALGHAVIVAHYDEGTHH